MKLKNQWYTLFILFVVVFLLSPMTLAGDVITWRCSSAWEPNTPHHETVLNWAKRVEELSGGRMQIRVYSGGELVPPFESRQAVADGSVDCAHAWSGFYMGTNIANLPIATNPAFMDHMSFLAWLKSGGGIEFWQELECDNLKLIFAGILPPELGMWLNKEINKIEDLRGIKFRAPIHMNEAMEYFGFSAIFIPPGEIVPALHRGVIDGAEFSTPSADLPLGFHEVAKYQYLPGLQQMCQSLELIVNRDKWEQLPDDLKVIVESAASLQVAEDFPKWWHDDTRDIRHIEAQTNVVRLSPEIQNAILNQYIELYEEYAAENELFAKMWESQKKFLVDYYHYKDLQHVEWEDRDKWLEKWANE